MTTLCLSLLLYYQLPHMHDDFVSIMSPVLYAVTKPSNRPDNKSSQVPRCHPSPEARPAQEQLQPTLPASHYQDKDH